MNAKDKQDKAEIMTIERQLLLKLIEVGYRLGDNHPTRSTLAASMLLNETIGRMITNFMDAHTHLADQMIDEVLKGAKRDA